MNKIQIGKQEIVHFIGIGGIGMSGLAQIMKTMGFNVQGSDISENKNIENCKKLGIKILIPSFLQFSVFLFLFTSLPWTLKPIVFIF